MSTKYKHSNIKIPAGQYQIDANLYLPTQQSNKSVPIIILGHGFSALQSMCLDKFAKHFTSELGIASLTFDCRGYGKSTGSEPTEYVNPYEQVKDWHTVINYVRDNIETQFPQIDEHRVSIWGSSFGGGHVLKVASDDAAIECCIAQVPFVGGIESLGMIPIVTQVKLLTSAIYDAVFSGIVGIVPAYRVANTAPQGELAVMTAPDAYPGFIEMSPTHTFDVYKHKGTTPARTMFHVLTYRPLWNAHHIIAKTLIMAAKHDSLIPYWAVERGAKRIYGVEFDGTTIENHFDPYNKSFDQTVAVQTDFLRRKLNL